MTDIPVEIVEFIKTNLKLNFSHVDVPIKLGKEKSAKQRTYHDKNNQKKDRILIGYRVNTSVKANIIPDIMYTPFEILNLIVTVEVPHI